MCFFKGSFKIQLAHGYRNHFTCYALYQSIEGATLPQIQEKKIHKLIQYFEPMGGCTTATN
uniref:Uncharacterized protein n=1 Tax=Anguilla anguilla TaxID=7936 RepID=A0A0E9WJI6_ANGAN